jgi:sulfur carrier protein ThiS
LQALILAAQRFGFNFKFDARGQKLPTGVLHIESLPQQEFGHEDLRSGLMLEAHNALCRKSGEPVRSSIHPQVFKGAVEDYGFQEKTDVVLGVNGQFVPEGQRVELHEYFSKLSVRPFFHGAGEPLPEWLVSLLEEIDVMLERLQGWDERSVV